MIIYGIQNQSVEISVVGYQFPNPDGEIYDINWLRIYLKVKSELGNWQTVDSSLLTWEIEKLADWLDTLANNKTPKPLDMEFIEPNLSFYLLNDPKDKTKEIKIVFRLESRPQSATTEREYAVVFKAENTELAIISKDFREELSKFPERKNT